MTTHAPIRLLLGPQRPTANLGEAVAAASLPAGRIAVISAGWQEAEGDIDDVRALTGRELVDLKLYARAEAALKSDEAMNAAYRARQQRLIDLQRLYRLRLRQLAYAARNVLRAKGDTELVAPEQRHAIAQLRALDRHHLHRVRGIHGEFSAQYNRITHETLARHAADIDAIADDCSGVLITGGNVIVLLNRLLLFGAAELLARHHVVAWSAGAMVLANHIVLFHDRTPLGRRDPELLGAGLGQIPGHVFLPDAKRRIREKDTARTSLLSRRLSPETCVTLDSGAMLTFAGGVPIAVDQAERLTAKGSFAKVRVA